MGLPVVVFTDGDPWSYRIFASVAYGAIKSAHLSEFMATPSAKFLGVQPTDILEYELSTDKLNEQDIKALHSELSDPRFDTVLASADKPSTRDREEGRAAGLCW